MRVLPYFLVIMLLMQGGYALSQTDTSSTNTTDTSSADDSEFDRTFTRVEKEATFPGGLAGWRDYLVTHLKSDVAAKAGAPPGMYSVKVQFIVDQKGRVGDVKVIDSPPFCAACSAEAIRVITKSPRWNPAEQDGRKVRFQALQTISFRVDEEELPKKKRG